jgi:ABC-type nitrate/sulfonate/bicarbonate transport system ATPase subunit
MGVNIKVPSFRYPNQRSDLIRHFQLQVAPRTFVSFVGPSGAGKTTLLKIIAGIEDEASSSVELNGRLVKRPGQDIQLVFEDYCVLPWKTARQNIEFALTGKEGSSGKNAVSDLLQSSGLHNVEGNYKLSAGQSARVAVARSLVRCPKILLMDEPFRNLDVYTKWDLQEYVGGVLSKLDTVSLMVSHDIEDAVYMSDVVHLFSGNPLKIVHSEQIQFSRPRDRMDLAFRATVNELVRVFVKLQELQDSKSRTVGVG